MVKISRRLGGESRISKVIVLKVRVIRELIEKALKSNMHGPLSQFVFPGRGVARNAGGVFWQVKELCEAVR